MLTQQIKVKTAFIRKKVHTWGPQAKESHEGNHRGFVCLFLIIENTKAHILNIIFN